MKKYLLILLALVMVFTIHSGAYSDDDDLFTLQSDSGTPIFKIDENGEMWYKQKTEIVSTNDTVLATESGWTFIASDGGGYASINFTLPAANDGLVYEFIQQGTGTLIELVPNGTDQFLYSTATASDHLRGPATAGASIKVSASDDTVWFVEANGTFSVVTF